MRRVTIESPYAGDVERNMRYLDACILDCLRRGETPYASHRMLTSALRDAVPEERERGMKAGFAMRAGTHATVVYTDLGMSGGMNRGIEDAKRLDEEQPHDIEYRELGGEWSSK